MNQLFSSEMDIHSIYEFCENHLNRLKLFTLLAGTSIAATGVRTRIVIAMVAHKWSLIRHWTDLSTNWWERRTNPARYMLCGFPYLDRWPNWNPPLELASFVTDMQPPIHTHECTGCGVWTRIRIQIRIRMRMRMRNTEHGHEHRQSVPMVKSKLSSFAALEYLYKYFTPPTWPNEAHFKLVFGHWC